VSLHRPKKMVTSEGDTEGDRRWLRSGSKEGKGKAGGPASKKKPPLLAPRLEPHSPLEAFSPHIYYNCPNLQSVRSLQPNALNGTAHISLITTDHRSYNINLSPRPNYSTKHTYVSMKLATPDLPLYFHISESPSDEHSDRIHPRRMTDGHHALHSSPKEGDTERAGRQG